MVKYGCDNCDMSVSGMTCGSCGQELVHGTFLWLQEPNGWIVGTKEGDPEINVFNQELTNKELSKSSITVEGKVLEIWSQLITKVKGENHAFGTNFEISFGLYSKSAS